MGIQNMASEPTKPMKKTKWKSEPLKSRKRPKCGKNAHSQKWMIFHTLWTFSRLGWLRFQFCLFRWLSWLPGMYKMYVKGVFSFFPTLWVGTDQNLPGQSVCGPPLDQIFSARFVRICFFLCLFFYYKHIMT